MDQGGLREAFVRSIIYIRLPELAADERSFAVLSKLREEHASDLSLADFKALVRDQFLMLELDEAQAVATIPLLLQGHGDQAAKALELLESVVTAPGPLGQEAAQRLRQIGVLFTAAAASTAGDAGADPAAATPADHRRWVRRRALSGGRPGRHPRRQRSSPWQRSRGASVPTLTGSGTNSLDIPRPRMEASRLASRA